MLLFVNIRSGGKEWGWGWGGAEGEREGRNFKPLRTEGSMRWSGLTVMMNVEE